MGTRRDGLVMSLSCQGEVQPVQRLSLSWGISGVLPALQSEVQTGCCNVPSPLALLSVLTLQPARGVTMLHVPRAVFTAMVGQCHGPA